MPSDDTGENDTRTVETDATTSCYTFVSHVRLSREKGSGKRSQIMKFGILILAVASLYLAANALADNYSNWVAQGYRWVNVNGPYACTTEQQVQQITGRHSDQTELQMLQNVQAYYLIPGTIAMVIKENPATGMTQMRLSGITVPLWTYTRFLSKRPIRDALGNVATPETSGFFPTTETGANPNTPENAGATPTPAGSPMTPSTPAGKH
jgi:hypothetical protein